MLDADNFFLTDETRELWETSEKPCVVYLDPFLRGVNQFLEFYRGPKVHAFELAFCLGADSGNVIDRWISSAVRMGVEVLLLHFRCGSKACLNFDDYHAMYVLRNEIFEGANSHLKKIYLMCCILPTNSLNQYFSSLEKLFLAWSPLALHNPESMFSCLVNLKTLWLYHCSLPEKLTFGSLVLLEKLDVRACSGVKKIELSNVYLRILSCITDQRKLCIFTIVDWVNCIPESIAVYSNVTYLSLIFDKSTNLDILKMSSILSSFPSLKRLFLQVHCPNSFEQGKCRPSKRILQRLEVVHIGGFCGNSNEIDFAIYLLKYASALERLYITRKLFHFLTDFRWKHKRADIRDWQDGEDKIIRRRLRKYARTGVKVILKN
ncbi:hypothetical protein Ancab_035641 [Ancistrocladus abbreviatus]